MPTSSTAHVASEMRICAIETRKSNADLPEDLQRDDHRREVQARVAELREEDRVRAPAESSATGRWGPLAAGARHRRHLRVESAKPLDRGRVGYEA